jgi:hypothetical protein
MHHVLLAENACAGVQQKSVQAIFKSIGVKKTNQESGGDSGVCVREIFQGNKNEDGT